VAELFLKNLSDWPLQGDCCRRAPPRVLARNLIVEHGQRVTLSWPKTELDAKLDSPTAHYIYNRRSLF
jgi:hypothetical protein